MTEAIKLPGTEMEVFEKYPDSRRLDFENFGSVCKTTYAKGVITDFEKISDNPIQVNSQVKVDIAGDEWLPLFYHPKAQYWDYNNVLATDFNEAGYFEKAWMSFRCGDEVAVMLKEGKPVAVLGFADGVPRVGEDVAKITTQSIHNFWDYEDDEHPGWPSRIGALWPNAYVRMNKIDFHDDAEKGPDGLDLKLLLEAARYDGPEELVKGGVLDVDIDHGAPYGTSINDEGGGWNDPMRVTLYSEVGVATLTKVALWILKVGPIVYAIYGKFRETYNKSITYYYVATPEGGEPILRLFTFQHIYGITRFMVKAGIYKEVLIADIVASLDKYPDWNYLGGLAAPNWWPVDIDGMFFQTDLTTLMQYLLFFDAHTIDEVKWFTRPHTKAELEVAGMWPAGG